MEKYQVVIIGGGPAGLSAGIYTSRAFLSTLILESTGTGGQAATTDIIENYPGYPDGIKGPDLMSNMEKQAKHFGSKIEFGQVAEIKNAGAKEKIIVLEDGTNIQCDAIIIAAGAKPNELEVPGEKKYRGRGVSYCATCDGAFFKNKDVAVVGGGNAALEEAIFLTKFTNKVYLIHRRDEFRGGKILQERILKQPKITIVLNSIVKEIAGNNQVEKIKIENVQTKGISFIDCSGIFIYAGHKPNTDLLKKIVQTDEKGYIITDDEMKTDIPGIFAAGDIRKKFLRQVVTAVGDGATAAMAVEKYLSEIS
ncbi:MAG: thioredoxin-disulfide reductase [bacterium]|nr:thioredoxin-disulfide reductase [bacterium]